MNKISTIEQLEALYEPAVERSLWKEIDHINNHYRQFIEASPFIILATYGDKGLDCSPRGDPAGFVRVEDEKTLLIPDRRGNNRLDSLRNIVVNPDVGLIFIVPGVGETVRVAGKAELLVDKDLSESFAFDGKTPRSIIRVHVEKAYFQCQKAMVRSSLWDWNTWPERSGLPTAGQMAKQFASARNVEFDDQQYDQQYSEHMKNTIY